MREYTDAIVLVNLLVDFLLLLAAARMNGCPVRWWRTFVAGALGGVYAGACTMPGFYFLGNILWRMVSLGAMGVISYGFSRIGFHTVLMFAFLSLALGGTITVMDGSGIMNVLGAAGIMALLCSFGFRGKIGRDLYLPVELSYGGKRLQLTALQDTGNTLRDPITGRQVLVIGADVAKELTGLTKEQLKKPVETLGSMPGLRLIPYRSVSNSSGFLLAMKLQNVKIGTWKGSALVAFAPECLGGDGTYQALAGGAV